MLICNRVLYGQIVSHKIEFLLNGESFSHDICNQKLEFVKLYVLNFVGFFLMKLFYPYKFLPLKYSYGSYWHAFLNFNFY